MSKFIKIRHLFLEIPSSSKEAMGEIILNVDQISFLSRMASNSANDADTTWILGVKNFKNPLIIDNATAKRVIESLRGSGMLMEGVEKSA